MLLETETVLKGGPPNREAGPMDGIFRMSMAIPEIGALVKGTVIAKNRLATFAPRNDVVYLQLDAQFNSWACATFAARKTITL